MIDDPPAGSKLMAEHVRQAAAKIAEEVDRKIFGAMYMGTPVFTASPRPTAEQVREQDKSLRFAQRYGARPPIGEPVSLPRIPLDWWSRNYNFRVKENPVKHTDIVTLVVAQPKSTETITRIMCESAAAPAETEPEFEARIRRIATQKAAASGSEVFVLRAAESISVPVTVKDLSND